MADTANSRRPLSCRFPAHSARRPESTESTARTASTALHAPFRGKAADGAAQMRGTGDRVTISPAAEAAIQQAESAGIRQDVVSRVRAEIAAGTYETPAKLDAALSRLLDEIG